MNGTEFRRVALRVLVLTVMVGALFVLPAEAQTQVVCRNQCIQNFVICLSFCSTQGSIFAMICGAVCQATEIACGAMCIVTG